MSFINRLLRRHNDPREELRPLWHRTVEISRQPRWYARLGVADTVPGRFDMITTILALVQLRLEGEDNGIASSALLTELFVQDMDGQLRESGVGDLVVGKRMGRLVSVLGGRIGAYRDALARPDDEALQGAIRRNVTMADETAIPALASELRAFHAALAEQPAGAILAGEIVE